MNKKTEKCGDDDKPVYTSTGNITLGDSIGFSLRYLLVYQIYLIVIMAVIWSAIFIPTVIRPVDDLTEGRIRMARTVLVFFPLIIILISCVIHTLVIAGTRRSVNSIEVAVHEKELRIINKRIPGHEGIKIKFKHIDSVTEDGPKASILRSGISVYFPPFLAKLGKSAGIQVIFNGFKQGSAVLHLNRSLSVSYGRSSVKFKEVCIHLDDLAKFKDLVYKAGGLRGKAT